MTSKRKKSTYRIGEISKGVLGVVAVAGIIPLLAVAPGLAMVIPMRKSREKRRNIPSKQTMERSIRSLVKNKLLKQKVSTDGTITLELTTKGRWEAGIRGYFKKDKVGSIKRWDGLWRLVIFDVPESKRKIRDELRNAASMYGFYQLQKSVWIYPYPCEDFIQLIKTHLGISRDVLYMTVNYLENDSHLRSEFSLKRK